MKSPDSHFYCEHIAIGSITLDENESNHAVRVCRAAVGDTLTLCDGKGHLTNATIEIADPKACVVRVDTIEDYTKNRPTLNIAIGCLKDDALEEVVFHGAQTQLNSITFLRTDFSQEPKNSDLHKLVHRSQLKSLVSLKQSKKAWQTEIHGPIEFMDWLKEYNGDLILCDIDGSSQKPELNTNVQTTLLIGPEGGFSPAEIQQIKNYTNGKVHLLKLGDTRLRARTAAIVALGKLL